MKGSELIKRNLLKDPFLLNEIFRKKSFFFGEGGGGQDWFLII